MEYRSGGTGGPHPGVDIFLDLSPRAKPYCGVKCSQWLHVRRGHNPHDVCCTQSFQKCDIGIFMSIPTQISLFYYLHSTD